MRKLSIISIGVGLSLITQIGFAQPAGQSGGDAAEPVKKKPWRSELSGEIEAAYKYFPDEALYAGQKEAYFATTFRPKYYLESDKGKHAFIFEGFATLDQYDNKRSHVDVRELYYRYVFKSFEVSLGAKKIYWGVIESNHLVDVINQADVLEGFDPENKLGQPMLHLSVAPKWGTLDLMIMPYFRELKFPGLPSRGRPDFLGLSLGDARYEAEAEEYNPDIALRWSHSFGVFDIGVSNFYGTSRLPQLKFDPLTWELYPYYETINQSGLDLQASTGPMLWKTEMMYRIPKDTARDPITAFVLGGEYTFGNLFRSGVDLGLLVEYSYDDRPLIESFNGLTNDMFFAARLALNDVQSTEFLGGVMIGMLNQADKTSGVFSGSKIFNVAASRRLGASWKLTVDLLAYNYIDEGEIFLNFLRNDSNLKIGLAKFF